MIGSIFSQPEASEKGLWIDIFIESKSQRALTGDASASSGTQQRAVDERIEEALAMDDPDTL